MSCQDDAPALDLDIREGQIHPRDGTIECQVLQDKNLGNASTHRSRSKSLRSTVDCTIQSNVGDKPKVYRVQGIPLTLGEGIDLRKMLGSILNVTNNTLRIRSLALSLDGRTKTATIELYGNFELKSSQHSFLICDEFLERGLRDQDDELVPKKHELIVDDHFRGLTVLRSISDLAKHEIE